MQHCPKCGYECASDARFCTSCGHSFVPAAAAQPPTTQPAVPSYAPYNSQQPVPASGMGVPVYSPSGQQPVYGQGASSFAPAQPYEASVPTQQSTFAAGTDVPVYSPSGQPPAPYGQVSPYPAPAQPYGTDISSQQPAPYGQASPYPAPYTQVPVYVPRQPYGAGMPPAYAQPTPPRDGAAASLVCGVLSLYTIFTVLGGLILGIIALVKGRSSRNGSNHLYATIGWISGLVGIVFSVLVIAFFSVAFSQFILEISRRDLVPVLSNLLGLLSLLPF